MASQDRGRDRSSRKLVKKRKESAKGPRGVSLDIPERFKDGDDAHEDVTAPKRNNTMSMNQSLFAMIARAGQQSQADLGTMQEVDSGDSDDEGKRKTPYHGLDGAARLSRLSTAKNFRNQPSLSDQKAEKSKHRRVLSENKLLRSLPKLKMDGKKDVRSESQGDDQMSFSQFLPPRQPSEAPPLPPANEQPSRTKAKATHAEDIPVENTRHRRRSPHGNLTGLAMSKGPATLAERIQQIFDFEDVEEVISEYPCWLLQSILLQGYMYITKKHLCFYAYIPKKHVRLNLLSPL
jgi:sterol 3beta-glucosyltransferase